MHDGLHSAHMLIWCPFLPCDCVQIVRFHPTCQHILRDAPRCFGAAEADGGLREARFFFEVIRICEILRCLASCDSC